MSKCDALICNLFIKLKFLRFELKVLFYMDDFNITLKSPSRVDAISELCSLFLKGGHYPFTAAKTSVFSLKKSISVTRMTTARMGQIERKWDLITNT